MSHLSRILLAALAASVALRFTLPTSHGGDSCRVLGDTLAALGTVELWSLDGTLCQSHRAGRPGSADSFLVEDGGGQTTYYVTTTSTGGSRSCRGNLVTIGGTASVEPTEPPIARRQPTDRCGGRP